MKEQYGLELLFAADTNPGIRREACVRMGCVASWLISGLIRSREDMSWDWTLGSERK